VNLWLQSGSNELAITQTEFIVMRTLRLKGVLPEGCSAIELGESNWYGDVPTADLARDVEALTADPARRAQLLADLADAEAARDNYRIARVFFHGLVGCAAYAANDPGTRTSEYKYDLNFPLAINQPADLVMNFGTGEHIFNVFQFYKTCHDLTRPGGLMVHQAPMHGWVDHGFYTFQPTFFYDIARANGYDVVLAVMAQLKPFGLIEIQHRDHVVELAARGELPANALINVVLKRGDEPREFTAPTQGYYAEHCLGPARRRGERCADERCADKSAWRTSR
jgi:hypothetical protein